MVFTPATKTELYIAIAGWIGGTINASVNDDTGNPYGEMGTWDVTAVTDMSDLFHLVWAQLPALGLDDTLIQYFNEDIGGWNVSGVTSFIHMFWPTPYALTAFNKDIRTWNVQSSSDLTMMFHEATAFQTVWYPTTPGYETDANTPTYEFFNQVAGNICFPAGTLVSLDQGDIEIQKVDTNKHTLNGKPILFVTKTIPANKNNVCFEKDAFEQNVPSQTVECSQKHLVEYNGERKRAIDFVNNDKITLVPNAYQTMYNLLLESHETMTVCNLQVETLYPANDIAIQYLKSKEVTDNQ